MAAPRSTDPADLPSGLAALERRLKTYLDPRTPVGQRSAEAWKIADAVALLLPEIRRLQHVASILNGGPK